MGNIIDKSKDNHEPTNQDAFVFWRALKKIYEDPDTLNTKFAEFLENYDDDGTSIGPTSPTSPSSPSSSPSSSPPSSSTSPTTNGNNSSKKKNSSSSLSSSPSPTKNESYVLMGQTSKNDIKQPVHASKISFVFSESPEAEAINRNLLATINCKLQLIPAELNHFTLNLDNHYISERMFLSICAAFLGNNKNYHNRHMATTLKETPINTIKKKKIQSELQDYISKYYFSITKLSLKKTLLSTRSLEGLSQVLTNNRSIIELDLGGNDLSCNGGIGILITGLRENKTVTRLNLSDVHAYDEGAFMLAAYLLSSKTIRIIDLSTNHITDKGFDLLFQSVIKNTNITSLFLSDNNIESSKIQQLNHVLKRNTSIQSIFDQIFDTIPWNRKFKNRVASFKKGVMKTRANSTLNIEQIEDDKTPLFRLMNKQGSSSTLTATASSAASTLVPEVDSSRYKAGKSETIGKRPTMEDRMVSYGNFRNNPNSELYCIFDGHGGRAASDFAADNIYRIFSEFLDANNTPEESFIKTYKSINSQISPWPFIGTTAASVYILEDKVYVANVGDSRVVLGKVINSNNNSSSHNSGEDKKKDINNDNDNKNNNNNNNNNNNGNNDSGNNDSNNEDNDTGNNEDNNNSNSSDENNNSSNNSNNNSNSSNGNNNGENSDNNNNNSNNENKDNSNEQKKKFIAKRLTFDHRPVEESERVRITEAGGTVMNGRVNGMLAVSRALGDSFLTPYVIPDPYLTSFTITKDDKFLILACDGVWDMISDEDAVDIVSKISDPSKAAEKLRDSAYSAGSTDNISVCIVKLNDDY